MEEDEILARITRLLEQGCTMLASHHDCGAPLFRCQGEVVCPVCSFGREEVSAGAEARPLARATPQKEISKNEGEATEQKGAEGFVEEELAAEDSIAWARVHLQGSLRRKLLALTAGLEEEQDLDKLKKQLDCIAGLLAMLHSLQR